MTLPITIDEVDGLPEDRITCQQCRELTRGRHCRVFRSDMIIELRRRCVKFVPIATMEDRRTGAERWPDILKQIEEIRTLDAEYRAFGGKRA